MPLLVVVALSSFAGGLLLPRLWPLLPAAHVHLALAMGVMPLIFGAMQHFIPVLTRGGEGRGLALLPFAALGAGALAVGMFVRGELFSLGLPVAAAMAWGAAAVLALWALRRGRAMLGSPHPGLHWYVAALLCLMLALLVVMAMPLWPGERLALKRFHLHLNLLGFVGLTALGTLQVLLPTAAGRFDQVAALRLKQGLPWAVAGVVLTAVGAAWWPPLAWLGLAAWGKVLWRLGREWWTAYRPELCRLHGAVPSLGLSAVGLTAALVAGGAQAGGWASATGTAHLFILGFLFPLVTGAAGQLLPLWLQPGRQTEWHEQARRRLTRWAGLRAASFLAGGMAVLAGWAGGFFLALLGLAHFAAGVAAVAAKRPQTG
ncbi:MAG: hypothetical protein AB7U30_12285 [Sulfuricellaceae bacterium]